MYEMAGQIGFTVGPLLGGLLYDAVARQTPFYINGAVLIAGALWVAFSMRSISLPTHIDLTLTIPSPISLKKQAL